MVRAFLTDGSILLFEPLELVDGNLVGQSPLYGRIAVPVAHIQHLVITEFGNEDIRLPYENWVVKGDNGKEQE
jgi:hypothetical protein